MIKIYTVPDCENCQGAKKLLNKMNVEYEEINLKEKENKEARAFYRSLGVKTAPVITNNDKWILTEFDEDILADLLEGK